MKLLLWMLQSTKSVLLCIVMNTFFIRDDASIICHLEDRDAPVYLYVPRKWHLEEKEQQEIDIELPQPSVVPPEKMIEDEPLLIEHLETYDLVQLKNLQDISSITVVTKDAEFQSYLTEFTNPPLLYSYTVIFI